MQKKLFLFALSSVALCYLVACNSSGEQKPITNDTNNHVSADQATTRGEELFRQRCQTCHGLSGNAQNNNAANLQRSVLDSIAIVATIKNGRNAMPMFSHTFSDSDLGQLALYVKSLRKR